MFGCRIWPKVGRSGWPNEGMGLIPAPAIAVNAVPVNAVLTNSRRVTLRDMRRMLILASSKDNGIDPQNNFSSTDYADYAERKKDAEARSNKSRCLQRPPALDPISLWYASLSRYL